jgi:hypothetical protein
LKWLYKLRAYGAMASSTLTFLAPTSFRTLLFALVGAALIVGCKGGNNSPGGDNDGSQSAEIDVASFEIQAIDENNNMPLTIDKSSMLWTRLGAEITSQFPKTVGEANKAVREMLLDLKARATYSRDAFYADFNVSGDLDNAELIIFGGDHTSSAGEKSVASALSLFSKKGELVLTDAEDKPRPNSRPFEPWHLPLWIFSSEILERAKATGDSEKRLVLNTVLYGAIAASIFARERDFKHLFPKLLLTNFWDQEKGNESMADEALRGLLAQKGRVFVLASAASIPTFQYSVFSHNKKLEQGYLFKELKTLSAEYNEERKLDVNAKKSRALLLLEQLTAPENFDAFIGAAELCYRECKEAFKGSEVAPERIEQAFDSYVLFNKFRSQRVAYAVPKSVSAKIERASGDADPRDFEPPDDQLLGTSDLDNNLMPKAIALFPKTIADAKKAVAKMLQTAREGSRYTLAKLQTEFHIVGNLDMAEVVLVGEDHVDLSGLKSEWGALNLLMKDGDHWLWEGNKPLPKEEPCKASAFPEKLFSTELYTQAYPDYEAAKRDMFGAALVPRLFASIEKQQPKFNAIFGKSVMCNNWDVQPGTAERANMVKRNESFERETRRALAAAGGKRVFVQTGALHTPVYQFAKFRHKNKGGGLHYLNLVRTVLLGKAASPAINAALALISEMINVKKLSEFASMGRRCDADCGTVLGAAGEPTRSIEHIQGLFSSYPIWFGLQGKRVVTIVPKVVWDNMDLLPAEAVD